MQQIERYEQKFLISPRTAQALQKDILPHVQRDKASSSGKYLVLSLYLDGERLPLYKATTANLPQRLKLRIRTYGSKLFYLEIKRKIRGMIWKSRVCLTLEQYSALFVSRRTQLRYRDRQAFTTLFQNLDTTQKNILEEFLYWKDVYGARPVMWVGYQREGFQSTDSTYARVTFDSLIKAQTCEDFSQTEQLISSYHQRWRRLDYASVLKSQQADIILELKSERLVPEWMSHLTQKYNLRAVGVSKYGLAIERHHYFADARFKGLRQVPHQNLTK